MKTYKGDLMPVLRDIVNTTCAKYGMELEPSIEEICQVLMDVEPADLPKCQMCEAIVGLTYCKWCHEWFCMDGCIGDHVHQDGYQA